MGSVAQNRTRDHQRRSRSEKEKPARGTRLGGDHSGTIERQPVGPGQRQRARRLGGILPPIRSHKHDAALDLVRQNERLIETRIDSLEQEARRTKQAWVGQVLAAAGDSDKRLLRDVVVYRAMWSVEDADNPLGERPPAESGRQEQHWANLNGRINHTFTTVKATKTQRMQAYQPIQAQPHVEQTALETGQERTTTWHAPFQDSSKPSQNGLSQ